MIPDLAIVDEVGLKDVLNVGGVNDVDIVYGGSEHPEGFVAAGDVGHEINKSRKVK